MKNRTAKTPASMHRASDDDIQTESSGQHRVGDSFGEINERSVDDISLNFFYKPHTVTLLGIAVVAVMYCAFVR